MKQLFTADDDGKESWRISTSISSKEDGLDEGNFSQAS